eukprot:gene12238-14171_t
MKAAFRYAEVGGSGSTADDNAVEVIVFNPMETRGRETEVVVNSYGHNDSDIPEKRGTVLSGYFSLTNTLLGSSVLGLPYAFSQTGWLVGSILLLICAASSAFALHTLSLCAMRLNKQEKDQADESDKPQKIVGATFYSVAKASLPQYTLIIDIAIALKCFGVSISYLIVVSDLMPFVASNFGATGMWIGRELWVVIGFCIGAPMCLLKDLSSLATVSSFAIVFVSFFALLVCLYGMDIEGFDPCSHRENEPCHGNIAPVVLSVHSLKAMPIFVFGFTCQQNAFAVCNEMRNITIGRVNISIVGSIATTLMFYLILAGVGYATFGSLVENDILVSYPTNYFTSIARVFISLLVLLSYPMQCHPARRCILTIIDYCTTITKVEDNMPIVNDTNSADENCLTRRIRRICTSVTSNTTGSKHQLTLLPQTSPSHNAVFTIEEDIEEGLNDDYSVHSMNSIHRAGSIGPIHADTEPENNDVVETSVLSVKSDALFYLVTAGFLLFSFVIAMSVSDLSVVLAFVGATGSTAVSYILPGFFYYYMFKNPEDGPAWKRNLALAQGIAGLIIVPLCK